MMFEMIIMVVEMVKMTGGTPEVRSDKSLTLMTFNIQHSTNGPMDQQTNGPMHYGAAVMGSWY